MRSEITDLFVVVVVLVALLFFLLSNAWKCHSPNKYAFFSTFYVFGFCFRTLAVILVSDVSFSFLHLAEPKHTKPFPVGMGRS